MTDTRKRVQIRPLHGPSGRELHKLTRTLNKAPRNVFIYRDSPEAREIIVSNYALEERAEKLVGVYDRTVTTEMLRADLYGIEEAEYRKTIKWGPGRPRQSCGVRA